MVVALFTTGTRPRRAETRAIMTNIAGEQSHKNKQKKNENSNRVESQEVNYTKENKEVVGDYMERLIVFSPD